MTTGRAVAIVIGSAILFAAMGCAVGYGLGVHLPTYYQSVFRNGREPGFEPVSVGVGQGLTQGAAAGIFAGLALVALLIWRETRTRPSAGIPSDPNRRPSRAILITVWVFATMLALFILGVFTVGGWIVGLVQGESGAYHRQYRAERELIAPAVVADPAFIHVAIEEKSDGGIYLIGDVATSEDLKRLHGIVAKNIGESRAAEALRGVEVTP